MRAKNGIARMRTILGTAALLVALSAWCSAQYGYPQSNYPQSNNSYDQSNNGYGQSNQIVVTQAPMLEYADPQTITIMWRTNVSATSAIRFGTDANNVAAGQGQLIQLNDNSRTHRVEMRNRFQPGTTYYFQLVSDRGNGDSIVSPLFSVQTPPQGAAPIRNQQLMTASNSGSDNRYADNDRDSDRDSNSRYNSRSANNGWQHRGESARNRSYGYGQQQNLPQSDVNSNIQITRPPMLQTLGDNIAVITWRTNAPSSSIVKYGTDAGNLTQTAEAPWGETTHSVTIQNLQPGTHYFFQVSSGQAKGTGTATNSETLSFTTQPQGAQPLQRVRPDSGQ
jgi:hypothetical protein